MEMCGNLMGHPNAISRDQTFNPPTTTAAVAAADDDSNNNNNVCWGNQVWELNSSRLGLGLEWANSMCLQGQEQQQQQQQQHGGHDVMCLKLGKRHYFEDASMGPASGLAGKRGKQPSCCLVAQRCQVEGCHVPLLNAKDYHRRHRVCHMHSKAPKVLLLGVHQRFCQQCSRFHVISEFDDSKRSCRRRLAGHNERRRKTNSHQSLAPPRNNNASQSQGYITSSATGCALSLLSSKNESWGTSSELSLRSSAALRELIAENRAAILARQLILDRGDCWQPNHTATADEDFGGLGFHQPQQQHGLYYQQQHQQQHAWERIHDENGGTHVTLDLMQPPNAAFGLLSVRGKSKEEDELWSSFQDQQHSHVV